MLYNVVLYLQWCQVDCQLRIIDSNDWSKSWTQISLSTRLFSLLNTRIIIMTNQSLQKTCCRLQANVIAFKFILLPTNYPELFPHYSNSALCALLQNRESKHSNEVKNSVWSRKRRKWQSEGGGLLIGWLLLAGRVQQADLPGINTSPPVHSPALP